MMVPSPATLDSLHALLELSRDRFDVGVAAAQAGGYQSFRVPKGNGKWRQLDVPAQELRFLQRAILDRLLARAPISPFAHGFVPGRSIVTNARVHLRTARSLFSVDLEDAYPSVSRDRVRGVIEWFCGPHLKAAIGRSPAELCELLADLCTHRDVLPQGAPTSGALLNLVCARLDRLCARLLRRHAPILSELRYSRYADDLSFSSSQEIPQGFRDEVVTAVLRSGFRPNRRKVHYDREAEGDLVICGVRLHGGELSLPRKRLRQFRALFHKVSLLDESQVSEELRSRVNGTLSFLTMVTSECPTLLEAPLNRLILRHGAWLPPARSTFKSLKAWQYGP